MKSRTINTIIAVVISLGCSAQNKGTDQFKWLCGNWQGNIDGGKLVENWKMNNNVFEGNSYFIMNADTIVKEVLRIEEIAGHWCYIASINGGNPVLFSLVVNSASKWIFENKEHNFPQRVVYNNTGNGKLTAWIEGEEEGKFNKEMYEMNKVN